MIKKYSLNCKSLWIKVSDKCKCKVSLHPSSPLSTGEPLRVCWPAASLSGTGTVVQQTARPSSGQWTQLQKSSVLLSPPSWIFSIHDAPAKSIVSWRTPSIIPTVSSSSYHQENGTRASEPRFFPQAVRALNHPPLSETPYKPSFLLKHGLAPPPPPPHTNLTTWKNNCQTFLCNSKCATHRWVGSTNHP